VRNRNLLKGKSNGNLMGTIRKLAPLVMILGVSCVGPKNLENLSYQKNEVQEIDFSEHRTYSSSGGNMEKVQYRVFYLDLDGGDRDHHIAAILDCRKMELAENFYDKHPSERRKKWLPTLGPDNKQKGAMLNSGTYEDLVRFGGIDGGIQVLISPEASEMIKTHKKPKQLINAYFNSVYPRKFVTGDDAKYLREGSWHKLLPEKPLELDFETPRIRVRSKSRVD
jgi:hypothetical protein